MPGPQVTETDLHETSKPQPTNRGDTVARDIDYEIQFKEIGDIDRIVVAAGFKRERIYWNAKQAFISAQRSEARGIDVAFAKRGGQYIVWTGAKA